MGDSGKQNNQNPTSISNVKKVTEVVTSITKNIGDGLPRR